MAVVLLSRDCFWSSASANRLVGPVQVVSCCEVVDWWCLEERGNTLANVKILRGLQKSRVESVRSLRRLSSLVGPRSALGGKAGDRAVRRALEKMQGWFGEIGRHFIICMLPPASGRNREPFVHRNSLKVDPLWAVTFFLVRVF